MPFLLFDDCLKQAKLDCKIYNSLHFRHRRLGKISFDASSYYKLYCRTRSIVVALSTSMNCIFPCLLCFCCISKFRMCRMYQFCEVISRVQSLISDKIGYSTGWHTLYEYSIISDSQNLVRYCIISANEYDVCCHTIKGHRVSYSKHNEASVMVRG